MRISFEEPTLLDRGYFVNEQQDKISVESKSTGGFLFLHKLFVRGALENHKFRDDIYKFSMPRAFHFCVRDARVTRY